MLRPALEMPLEQIAAECDRAAQEFLAIEGWNCPKAKVREAVTEMIACSRRSTFAMAWLLTQTTRLPVQAEPARRLQDLVKAISAVRRVQIGVRDAGAENRR